MPDTPHVRVAIALSSIAGALTPAVTADVSLPAIISDHMVLQQQTESAIWGWARPGEAVTVSASWRDEVLETAADDRGRWRVALPTPEAGGPHTIGIEGSSSITLRDVLIGEVWICSGQSNMEWSVATTLRGADAAEIESVEREVDLPQIRLFIVENTISAPPRGDCRGSWSRCNASTVMPFSAVGYAFGRELHERLGVPIGLVSADWGGTVAQAWMSAAALRDFGGFDEPLDLLEAVQDPARRAPFIEQRVEGWWSGLDRGGPVAEGWTALEHDDADWTESAVPSTWTGELGGFDGVVHVRLPVDLPAEWDGRAARLDLGPVDDYDDTWINGVHVGATHAPDSWSQPRRYDVPAGLLRAGRNVVAVRVLDTGGLGGINGSADRIALRGLDGSASIALSGPARLRRGRALSDLPEMPRGPAMHPNMPSVLFNGMISPLTSFAIRGAIWYQGESNRRDAGRYRSLFPALIEDWRRQWGRGDFPFYFVQIAPYRYQDDAGETAAVREAQLQALRVPGTGMAVTLDIGDPLDIHPGHKSEVGRRLALWARTTTYGEEDLVRSGPLFRSMSIEGSAARLRFDDASSGLELRPTRRSPFLIAGADRRFVPAEAVVDGDAIVLTAESVEDPVAVRYAWEAAPEPSLFNGEGLPASPFRTDDFEGELPPVDNGAEMAAHRSREPGFVDLFNGRDLDGWHVVNGAPSTWRAEDGIIRCSGIPTGVMRTDRQHENFVLELEWRHLRPGGNAGVFVWSDPLPARGQPYTRGIEVQVLDGREGSWYTSDGDIFPIHGASMTPENGREGSRAFPTERRANPAPLWNHYRITCRDGSIALAVNGAVVTRGIDARPRRGYICLESEGSPVEFRNVRIRPLPPSDPPPPPAEVADPAEGFVALYNGVDLAGWLVDPAHAGHWRPADWRLDFDGVGPDLWSERSFGDFELICDWRWSGDAQQVERPVILPSGEAATDGAGEPLMKVVADAGDSGIYLRGSSQTQVNIWCWPIGSGEVYGYRTDAAMPPEVRAGVTPTAPADAPIGEWNRFRIRMAGDRLTVRLNGVPVIEGALLPGVAAVGPIALQRHGAPIQFANVYIRELD